MALEIWDLRQNCERDRSMRRMKADEKVSMDEEI